MIPASNWASVKPRVGCNARDSKMFTFDFGRVAAREVERLCVCDRRRLYRVRMVGH